MGGLEASVTKETAVNDKENFKLAASQMLVQAVKSCFHEEIFLRPLGDKFLKLSFQLVAR